MIIAPHQDKSLLRRGIFKKSITASGEKSPKRKFFKVRFKGPSFPKYAFPATLFKKKKTMIGIALGCVLVIGGGAGYWIYENNLAQNPAVIYAKKLKTLTQQVGQSVTLPTNETPVIATVTDKTALPNEPFFSLAQNGDKLIMYKKNKKVILYRPSTDKVVSVATLDFENIAPTPIIVKVQPAVAGASTSAAILGVTPGPASSSSSQYIPQGKILIQPQQ